MNSTINYWLRWILFIPSAILAYLLAYSIIEVLFNIQSFFWEQMPEENEQRWWRFLFPYLIKGLGASYLFIYAGVYAAPSFKRHVSILLSAIMIGVFAINIYMQFYAGFSWVMLFESIGRLIGALIFTQELKGKPRS